jgi:hypothetical protein
VAGGPANDYVSVDKPGGDVLIGLLLMACSGDDSGETGDTTVDTDTSVDTDTTDTDGDTDVVEGTELTGDATIWADCGPADGAALRLSVAQIDGECAVDGSNPRNAHPLTFYFWSDLPSGSSLPHTLDIGTEYSVGGSASYSPTPSGPTFEAVSGSVTFTSYVEETSAAGTWTVTLPDETVLYGTFDAAWCEKTLLCG